MLGSSPAGVTLAIVQQQYSRLWLCSSRWGFDSPWSPHGWVCLAARAADCKSVTRETTQVRVLPHPLNSCISCKYEYRSKKRTGVASPLLREECYYCKSEQMIQLKRCFTMVDAKGARETLPASQHPTPNSLSPFDKSRCIASLSNAMVVITSGLEVAISSFTSATIAFLSFICNTAFLVMCQANSLTKYLQDKHLTKEHLRSMIVPYNMGIFNGHELD